jgi:hypothetical protein
MEHINTSVLSSTKKSLVELNSDYNKVFGLSSGSNNSGLSSEKNTTFKVDKEIKSVEQKSYHKDSNYEYYFKKCDSISTEYEQNLPVNKNSIDLCEDEKILQTTPTSSDSPKLIDLSKKNLFALISINFEHFQKIYF